MTARTGTRITTYLGQVRGGVSGFGRGTAWGELAGEGGAAHVGSSTMNKVPVTVDPGPVAGGPGVGDVVPVATGTTAGFTLVGWSQ